MSCPSCDHTMQSLAFGIWWCPRCGTLRSRHNPGNLDVDEVPRLVQHLRARDMNEPGSEHIKFIDLRECYLLPEERRELHKKENPFDYLPYRPSSEA